LSSIIKYILLKTYTVLMGGKSPWLISLGNCVNNTMSMYSKGGHSFPGKQYNSLDKTN